MSEWLDEAGTDALFGDGHVPCLRVLATGHGVGWDPDRSVVPSQADRPEHILALAATSIGASLHDLRLQGALPDPPYACEDARARRFVRVRACVCVCVRVCPRVCVFAVGDNCCVVLPPPPPFLVLKFEHPHLWFDVQGSG